MMWVVIGAAAWVIGTALVMSLAVISSMSERRAEALIWDTYADDEHRLTNVERAFNLN